MRASRAPPRHFVPPSQERKEVTGNVNLGLVAAACWARERENMEMVDKGSCSTGEHRKNSQRKKPDVAGVMRAKEEEVSRRKGWFVTVRPSQKVDFSSEDRFSRAEETGELPA